MHDSARPDHRLYDAVYRGMALWGLCFALHSTPVHGQNSVIDQFQPSQIVAGDWRVVDGELLVGATPGSRAVIATTTPRSYSLTVEFTRTDGDNSVGVILPVGSSQCALITSVFNGEAHGIGIIDGMLARDNVSTIKPGTIESGHPYRLLVEVDLKGDTATISSTLDGRAFLQWSGMTKSLSMLDRWAIRAPTNVGLISYSPTTFHSIVLTPLDPSMRMTQPMAITKSSSRSAAGQLAGPCVLYDQAHGQPAVGRLNRFADDYSFKLQVGTQPISAAALREADVLWIRAPTTRFAPVEVDAIEAFVGVGGSLLLVMDEERRTSLAETGANEIVRSYGLEFTDDTEYLHNCGAICKAGDIHASDREVPFSGGRAVSGGNPFGYQLDAQGNPGRPFATAKKVDGGGRIVILADAMAAGLMGTSNGQRLSGVPRDPSNTTYWGKDSTAFLAEVMAWLVQDE